jgi:hypothetical protein
MMDISPSMIRAVKVRLRKPIFEDDFPEKGMVAWVTDVTWEDGSYRIWMDFSEFEAENSRYFKQTYYPNRHTQELTGIPMERDRNLYTAIEAGLYHPKYNVYWSVSTDERDDELFQKEVLEEFFATAEFEEENE